MGKRMRSSDAYKKDRISELPEHLKHQILSYLPIREAAATTILSPSWKDLWLTLSCFHIDEKFFPKIIENHPDISHEQLLIIVDQIFTKRSMCTDIKRNNISLKELKLHIPILNMSTSGVKIPDSIIWLVNKFIIWAVNDFQAKKLDFSFGFWKDYMKEKRYNSNVITKMPLSFTALALWKTEAKITDLALRGFVLNSSIRTKWSTLRSLSLEFVNLLDQQLLDGLFANCLLIECLKLHYCTGDFDTLNVSCLRKLVTIHIVSKVSLKKIDINAPNLETFLFNNESREHMYKSCVIHDLALSKGLNVLQICKGGTDINDEWLNHLNIAQLTKLKTLNLYGCPNLRRIRISSTSLDRMSLFSEGLEEFKVVDASKLLELMLYNCSHTPSFMLNNTSALTTVGVWFWPLHMHSAQREHMQNYLKYEHAVKYLSLLNGVKNLKLHFSKKFFVPPEIKKRLNPSLDAVKDQKLTYILHYEHYRWNEQEKFSDLIDDLLWLSLRPVAVVILFCRGVSKQFEFDFKVDEYTLEKCDYCKCLPVRCWRHYLDGVTVKHVGVSDSPSDTEVDADLKGFFKITTNSRNIDVKIIYDHESF